MTKNDATRREFLVRTIVSAGAVAGAGIVPDAYAQPLEQSKQAGPTPHAQAHRMGSEHGAFFNHDDSLAIAAFTERLMPGATDKPGARDAGVLNYIDLALAGAYADLQDFYRRGLAQLEAQCRKNYQRSFVHLEPAQMDDVITTLEQGRATEFVWPSAQDFFNTLRIHTIEGMFADPIYGGNKDFAGWRLVGFPGAQEIFTPTDLQNTKAFQRASMVGLQAVAGDPMRKE